MLISGKDFAREFAACAGDYPGERAVHQRLSRRLRPLGAFAHRSLGLLLWGITGPTRSVFISLLDDGSWAVIAVLGAGAESIHADLDVALARARQLLSPAWSLSDAVGTAEAVFAYTRLHSCSYDEAVDARSALFAKAGEGFLPDDAADARSFLFEVWTQFERLKGRPRQPSPSRPLRLVDEDGNVERGRDPAVEAHDHAIRRNSP